jgi:hypothetical protein
MLPGIPPEAIEYAKLLKVVPVIVERVRSWVEKE